MFYIYTLFDYSKYPYIPLVSAIYTDTVELLTLYLPKTGLSLYDIEMHKQYIADIIRNKEVILNDFKSHLHAFNLELDIDYNIYEAHVELPLTIPKVLNEAKKYAVKVLSTIINIKPDKYRLLLANAQVTYKALEERGFLEGSTEHHPVYGLTYTGRSKTSGNNIQGADGTKDIYHTNLNYEYLLHFDWIAADLRVASLMSNDEKLQASFIKSDPYTMMATEVEVPRDSCKLDMLKGLYALNFDSASLAYYPRFRQWLIKTAELMDNNGYINTIMGRKFYLNQDENNRRSVFNSMFQGSVAHAMQSALYRIYKIYPEHILTETHDAIILACNKYAIKDILKVVSGIMLHPFLNDIGDPAFPVRVSIGTKWKKWKLIREYR